MLHKDRVFDLSQSLALGCIPANELSCRIEPEDAALLGARRRPRMRRPRPKAINLWLANAARAVDEPLLFESHHAYKGQTLHLWSLELRHNPYRAALRQGIHRGLLSQVSVGRLEEAGPIDSCCRM